jgi:hypothetical protein
MRQLGQLIGLGTALCLLVGGAVAIFWLVTSLVEGWSDLDRSIATLTAVGVLTLLLTAQVIASGIRGAKKLELDERARWRKAKAYLEFLEAWYSIVSRRCSEHVGDGLSQKDLMVMLLGGSNVVRQCVELRKHCLNGDGNLSSLLDDILREMRCDLGHRDIGFPGGYLVGVPAAQGKAR